jgi:hypothetical protein
MTRLFCEVGRGRVVDLVTRWTNPGVGENFRTRLDRPWGPPNLLYNGYRVSFLEVKKTCIDVHHPPPSSAKVKEREELHLYLYSPLWVFTACKKGKVHLRRSRDAPEKEFAYNYTLSLTSALFEGLGGQCPAPAALSPGKVNQYPLYRRLAGPKGRSEQVQKTSPPPVSDPGTVQPLVSRYTNFAIPSHSRPVLG